MRLWNLIPATLLVLGLAAQRPEAVSGAPFPRERCPDGWKTRRQGGCWTERDRGAPFYVHPGGWLVEPACLEDGRFTARQLHEALSAAWAKMSPKVPVDSGGCMAAFNPGWGRELVDSLWAREVRVACPAVGLQETRCATYRRDLWGSGENLVDRHVLELRAVARCGGSEGTGLAGILFHETLHSAGADNYDTEAHNRAWELPQFKFIRDRVYGAEAVCFFGVKPELRPLVNFLQCRELVSYRADHPRLDRCRDFDASFHDRVPAGFLKH